MKKIITMLAVAMSLALSSCGVGNSTIVNQNQSSTQVHLTSNNFKVVQKIEGYSEVTYVCLIGGTKQTHLYENAYAAMMSKAELTLGSRAIINVIHEEHIGGVPPFYYKRTITVSAYVIEFIK